MKVERKQIEQYNKQERDSNESNDWESPRKRFILYK